MIRASHVPRLAKTAAARAAAALAAAALALGGAAAPAEAAADGVVIATPTQVQAAAATGTAVVKPVAKAKGRAKVKSKTLRVKLKGKVVADKAKSAALPAGTYAVKTTVTYKTYKTVVKRKAKVRKTVGAKAMKARRVTCVASAVERFNDWSAAVTATCSSRKFSGQLAIRSSCATMPSGWSCREDPDATLGVIDLPKKGTKFAAVIVPWQDLYLKTVIRPAKTVKKWSKLKTAAESHTLAVLPPPGE
jgi:hypothetical protein